MRSGVQRGMRLTTSVASILPRTTTNGAGKIPKRLTYLEIAVRACARSMNLIGKLQSRPWNWWRRDIVGCRTLAAESVNEANCFVDAGIMTNIRSPSPIRQSHTRVGVLGFGNRACVL